MIDALKPEQIAELEQAEARATDGPWTYHAGIFKHYVDIGDYHLSRQQMHPEDGRDTNAQNDMVFISVARDAVPALLAERKADKANLAEKQSRILALEQRLENQKAEIERLHRDVTDARRERDKEALSVADAIRAYNIVGAESDRLEAEVERLRGIIKTADNDLINDHEGQSAKVLAAEVERSAGGK